MELIFFDESGDSKFKNYFGLCMAVVNSSHYSSVKRGFHSVLEKYGWPKNQEFKGSHIFSSNRGPQGVSTDQRVDMAGEILDLTSSRKNSKFRFFYYRNMESSDHKVTYLHGLQKALNKGIKRKKGSGHKEIVFLSYDSRSDVSVSDVRDIAIPVISKKRLVLCEELVMADSNYHTVGILLADIVAYLASRIDTISNDEGLFEQIPEEEREKNGKLRKLRASTKLIEKVKKIGWETI